MSTRAKVLLAIAAVLAVIVFLFADLLSSITGSFG